MSCKRSFTGLFMLAMLTSVTALGAEFDFKSALFGTPSSLNLFVKYLDVPSGVVIINGGDTQGPNTPFSWDWGDGIQNEGFFPQQHVYDDQSRNYVVTVVSHYPNGGSDSRQITIRFIAPQIMPIQLPPNRGVSISSQAVQLVSRMPGYGAPSLDYFYDSLFQVTPRATIEYVLSVATVLQNDFANGDVALVGAGFEQVVLLDASLSGSGMYSLWFTDPVAFAAAGESVSGAIPYSSFFHEMGHNFTLNSPADFYFGGKIDGNANAIFSESMAQIFQHATAFELINHSAHFGLSADLVVDLKVSAVDSMGVVRSHYDSYVNGGMPFESWNDPSTPEDETFGTFMTVAYLFFEQAETGECGYGIPLRRMMRLLHLLDQSMVDAYDAHHDTAEAEAFRSTLMIAALSHAFGLDLRSVAALLNFPVNHTAFGSLLSMVQPTGDLDGDADVDLADHHLFVHCMNLMQGQSLCGYFGTIPPECFDADFISTQIVDLLDFALLQRNLKPN